VKVRINQNTHVRHYLPGVAVEHGTSSTIGSLQLLDSGFERVAICESVSSTRVSSPLKPSEVVRKNFPRISSGNDSVAKVRGKKSDSISSKEFFEAITRLTELDHGWNGYSAPAPSMAAICDAYDLLSAFLFKGGEHKLRPAHVGASTRGGVGFTFLKNDREFVVEILNSGKIVCVSILPDDTIKTCTIPFLDEQDIEEITRKASEFLELSVS